MRRALRPHECMRAMHALVRDTMCAACVCFMGRTMAHDMQIDAVAQAGFMERDCACGALCLPCAPCRAPREPFLLAEPGGAASSSPTRTFAQDTRVCRVESDFRCPNFALANRRCLLLAWRSLLTGTDPCDARRPICVPLDTECGSAVRRLVLAAETAAS